MISVHSFRRGLGGTSLGHTFPRERRAAQKEAADAQKKKRTKEVQQKEEKKEVAQRVRAGEHGSEVELELVSDDPTDLDDMVFSDEEES